MCIGLRKKLEKLAKNKDCRIIGKWQQSIINHLYWSVVSSSCDDADMIKARWLSLENHIHNKHSGHGKLFPNCSHSRLQRRDQNKKWLKRRKFDIISEKILLFILILIFRHQTK